MGISATTAHPGLAAALASLASSALENVAVADLVRLVPAVLLNGAEPVRVSDAATLRLAALVLGGEPISVSDAATLRLAVRLVISERLTVSDRLLDATAPTVTLSGKPTNPSGSRTASFTFAVTDPDDTGGFTAACRLDEASFATCASPVSYTSLADGGHTFTVHATDAAGNRSNDVTSEWSVDATPPTVQCDAPDVAWHAGDVLLLCTASDSGVGLASQADASFSLSTNVPPGSETANAATNSRTVCDKLNNCTTVALAGIKVDKKAPTMTASAITSVDAKPYTPGTWTNQTVEVSFSCVDAGSGVVA